MICLSRILLRPGILFAPTEVLVRDSAAFDWSVGLATAGNAQRDVELLREKGWENCHRYYSSSNFNFVYLESFDDRQESRVVRVDVACCDDY